MPLFGILLLSIGLPILYIMAAGFIGSYLVDTARLECSNRGGDDYCEYYACEHGGWWIAGLLWPLAMPFLLAAGASQQLAVDHAKGINRAERKRLKELEQAEHKNKLAMLREKEVELMEREAGIRK